MKFDQYCLTLSPDEAVSVQAQAGQDRTTRAISILNQLQMESPQLSHPGTAALAKAAAS